MRASPFSIRDDDRLELDFDRSGRIGRRRPHLGGNHSRLYETERDGAPAQVHGANRLRGNASRVVKRNPERRVHRRLLVQRLRPGRKRGPCGSTPARYSRERSRATLAAPGQQRSCSRHRSRPTTVATATFPTCPLLLPEVTSPGEPLDAGCACIGRPIHPVSTSALIRETIQGVFELTGMVGPSRWASDGACRYQPKQEGRHAMRAARP